jgi:formylglycine-generating enzyme required for sulfatase activity
MIKVPAGVYKPFIKVDAESATKPIPVKSFFLDQYPVTKKDYSEFIQKNPKWKKENTPQIFADDGYLEDWKVKKEDFLQDSPVTYISWFSAKAYCESYGLRLPTVNEWEYAAAASESKKNANREENFLRRILNWYGEPQGEKLKDVGSIYKNVYGIWDMHGLIWEWVDDFNSSFVTGESREDSSFNKDMFCGAGALSSTDKENYAAFMRFAFRSGLKGKSSVWNLGFRCIK